MKTDEYPVWICSECAAAAGAKMGEKHVATFHMDVCDVCNHWKSVTEPRDYGYPKVKMQRDKDLIRHELCKARREAQRNGYDLTDEFVESKLKDLA